MSQHPAAGSDAEVCEARKIRPAVDAAQFLRRRSYSGAHGRFCLGVSWTLLPSQGRALDWRNEHPPKPGRDLDGDRGVPRRRTTRGGDPLLHHPRDLAITVLQNPGPGRFPGAGAALQKCSMAARTHPTENRSAMFEPAPSIRAELSASGWEAGPFPVSAKIRRAGLTHPGPVHGRTDLRSRRGVARPEETCKDQLRVFCPPGPELLLTDRCHPPGCWVMAARRRSSKSSTTTPGIAWTP